MPRTRSRRRGQADMTPGPSRPEARQGPARGAGTGQAGKGGRAPPREGRAWRGGARRAPILGTGSPGLSPGRADRSAIAGPGGRAWRRGGSSPWRGGCSAGEVARWSLRWSELVSHTLEPAGLRSDPRVPVPARWGESWRFSNGCDVTETGVPGAGPVHTVPLPSHTSSRWAFYLPTRGSGAPARARGKPPPASGRHVAFAVDPSAGAP